MTMQRFVLAGLLAALIGCLSHITTPVVEAKPQLQKPIQPLKPQPFEGAVVTIDVITAAANLDCLACGGTMRAGRALVRLMRLGPTGEPEPVGDSFAVLVAKDFKPNETNLYQITRYVSASGVPHRILSHFLNEETGRFEPDVIEIWWALVE